MSYSEQAAAAKVLARDILRTEMAIRVQERVSKAKASLTGAIKDLVLAVQMVAKNNTATADIRAKIDAETDATRQAIGSTPGLTTDELAAVSEDLDASVAATAVLRAETDAQTADADAAMLKNAQARVDAARAEYEKHQSNLVKLEAGELKVDKEALDELTNKLIEEGRVPAGTATATTAPTGDVEEEA